MILRIVAIVFAVVAVGSAGYAVAVLHPEFERAQTADHEAYERLQNLGKSVAPGEPYPAELAKRAQDEESRTSEAYYQVRGMIQNVSLAGIAAGFLSFVLALVATRKQPKGFLALGIAGLVVGVGAWAYLQATSAIF
jgi:small-conductance mechanosensitive channel